MDKGIDKKKRRWAPWIFGTFVLVSFTVLILLQSSNLWRSLAVETASDTLLLYALSTLNFIALIVFSFIFIRSIIKLRRERRALQLGSRLKSKLLAYFAAISLLPIIAMAVFSYLFMNRALERWFSQVPENVIRESRDLGARSNLELLDRLDKSAQMLAASLTGRDVSAAELERLKQAGGLSYASIIGLDDGLIVATSADRDIGASSEFGAIKQGRLDDLHLRDGVGVDAAVAEIDAGRRLVIVSNPRSTESVSQLADRALNEFDRMKDRQITVRQVGLLTLGVLTFLLIFASTWAALYLARGLTGPIRALAEGAEEIAHGNLGHRVDVIAEDELGLLVRAFNDMSAKLESNSAELTERRRYIETVLLSLPTGVISVDPAGRIDTINPAARLILGLSPGKYRGHELDDLLGPADRERFERVITRAKRTGHASDQLKLDITGENSGNTRDVAPVAVTATALPEGGGVVLVIEDLSELIAAQRASAWQEVARRMAHEIKNPLTPIQLSAERIAKRFMSVPMISSSAAAVISDRTSVPLASNTPADDANTKVVLDGTETILREVQGLKAMVDEFSRFARLPEVQLEAGDLNEIVRLAAELYLDREDAVIELNLADDLPEALVDDEQLKRVFVNLIDNAIEAPGADEAVRRVTVSTRYETARDLLLVEVSDNGRGIDPADYQKLFQPYFSTKGRGTGLGLAIVHRIVTDHHGRIKAVPNLPNGAKFIVELPAPS